jgi:hypothetical protein
VIALLAIETVKTAGINWSSLIAFITVLSFVFAVLGWLFKITIGRQLNDISKRLDSHDRAINSLLDVTGEAAVNNARMAGALAVMAGNPGHMLPDTPASRGVQSRIRVEKAKLNALS